MMTKIGTWIKSHKAASMIIAGVVLLLIWANFPTSKPHYEKVTYTEFAQDMEADSVVNIQYGNGEDMVVTLKDGTVYQTAFPAYADFRKDMLEKGVELKILQQEKSLFDTIYPILSLSVTVLVCLWFGKLFKAQMGAGENWKESNLLQTSTVKFADVIGQDEIRNDIMFYADILKNPLLGDEFGASAPKGILFEGGPGCGKTMIAKAIAGEAGVPFISVSGASFIEKYVGVGAQRVRKVFEVARQNAPCVVFIDEIDAVGCKRGHSASSEHDQTINALLTEMDGFGTKEGILVVAATNRADMLDEALVRAGRFDRTITIHKPKDWKVRKDLFNHYLKGKKLAEDVDLDCLSKQISGYTGADIKAACNEAATIALQKKKKFIDMDCLEEAIDKKIFGGNRVPNKEERTRDKEIVAYHEAGHAVVTFLSGKPIARASIIGTTSGVGGAVFREDENSQFMTKTDAEIYVKIAYGGRASEEIKFGKEHITTGASNDIQQATRVLGNAVGRYGFYSEDNGLIDVGTIRDMGMNEDKETLALMHKKSQELYKETVNMLSDNYDLVTKLAERLIEVETMSGDEIEDLLGNKKETA